MTDPIRAALERLVEAHDAPVEIPVSQWTANLTDAIAAGKAALAGEQGEGPTPSDEELLAAVRHLYGDQKAADMGAKDDLRTARAVLSRWGNPAPQPTPPAEGEVGELVAKLRTKATTEYANGCDYSAVLLARAADLLAQRHPTPVSVSERWPEFSDCESNDDRVWCWNPFLDHWKLSRIKQGVHTHWLPAHALPLPQGEVK